MIIRILPIPLRKILFFWFAIFTRATTLGVRIIIRNDAEHILLVEHTYISGWHLPGGGVERNETLAQAAQKEMLQETGIVPTQKLQHLHTFANFNMSRFDHVALFECKNWEWAKSRPDDYEIARAEFFPADELPQSIDRRTRRHIAQYLGEEDFDEIW